MKLPKRRTVSSITVAEVYEVMTRKGDSVFSSWQKEVHRRPVMSSALQLCSSSFSMLRKLNKLTDIQERINRNKVPFNWNVI